MRPSGNLLVAEKLNNRVQQFSPSGEYLGSFGTKGSGSGQMIEPRGIAISGKKIHVVDTGNNRIQEWVAP